MYYALLLLLTLLLPSVWATDVYKWVDAEGNVHYGDQPAGKAAKKVDLPGLSHYEPPPVKRPAEAEPQGVTPGDAPSVGPTVITYRDLRIISPEEEATIRSNEGIVDVFAAVAPILGKEHYIIVTLDGSDIPDKYSSSVFRLANVDRGVHKIRLAIHDSHGKKLIESATVTFYMHQASIANKPRPK